MINVFFTVWTMLHVLALFSEMRAVVEIQQRLVDMGEFHFQTPSESLYLASMFMALQLAGILAALYFMWTVRHPAQLRK